MNDDPAPASLMVVLMILCVVMTTLMTMGAIDVVVMVAHWVHSL